MYKKTVREVARDTAKDAVFHGIRSAELVVRGIDGSGAALDCDSLRRIKNFILPVFETALGCLVHTTPLVEALRSALPDAHIVAATSRLGKEVLQHDPALNAVVHAADPKRDFWGAVRGLRQIVSSFQGEPYAVLLTPANARSRVVLAVMFSGDGVRVGFAVGRPLLHLPLDLDCGQSQIANALRILKLLGHSAPETLEPRVYFTHAELDYVRPLLGNDLEHPVALLVARTSGGQPTAWPTQRFITVAKHMVSVRKCRVVLSGAKVDIPFLDDLAERIGGDTLSLAGKTSIPELAAVCALSDIAVALDTGAMHIARSQELPMVIIAPAWQSSVEWMPLAKPWARILKGPWFPAPPPPNYAIEEVTVEQVVAAADDLLRLFPPSFDSRERRARRSLIEAAS